MCNKNGMEAHFAISLETYRYNDGQRLVDGHICRECAAKTHHGTIQKFFDNMMGEDAVPLKVQ